MYVDPPVVSSAVRRRFRRPSHWYNPDRMTANENSPDRWIEKETRAAQLLRSRAGRVVAALSGGVDSAVLTLVAARALGAENVVAVTARSASLPAGDLEDAARVAIAAGVRHEVVETRELDRPEYRANAGDRCFHCRTELFEVLEAYALGHGYETVAYGAIADDRPEDRPGMAAADARGILEPLRAAGWTKEDVRAAAAAFGLDVRDKPASACLASRIPTGTPVSSEKLAQIAAAEAALRSEGIVGGRVRHHGEIARIEISPGDWERAVEEPARSRIAAALRGLGFRYVALDLDGYRPGGRPVDREPLVEIGPARDSGQ